MRHSGHTVAPDRLFLFPLVMSDELTLLLCMSAALRGFLFWNGLRLDVFMLTDPSSN